jgi:phosphonate transport system permease protein
MAIGTVTTSEKRAAFLPNWPKRAAWALFLVYVAYAISTLDISAERVARGMEQGAKFLGRLWPPNFEPKKLELLREGMIESIQIAIISTVVGVILSVPLGLLSARNLMPSWASWLGRTIIALCRSFHSLIMAILFVKAVGFGALAGILALVIASMGFVAKLFAEAIEEMNLKQVEAVRASGASFLQVLVYGVMPQVLPRFIGFSAYQLDSNLRNSTMVGIVGGGGIGATLFTAYQRFDYDFVMTILLTIIAIVIVSEIVTGRMRRLFQ